MTVLPSPRIPINTVEELFNKLKWEEARLLESLSVYDSWNFVVTAHHLSNDWIKKQLVATQEQKDRQADLPVELKRLFVAFGNIADGSKHFDLTWAKKGQIVAEVSEPETSDYDSYFFGDMIYVTYDAYRISIWAASEIIVKSLEWIIFGGDRVFVDDLSVGLAGTKIAPSP